MYIKEHKFSKSTNDNNRKQMITIEGIMSLTRGLKPIPEAKHTSHSDSSEVEPSNVNDVEERSEVKTWPRKTILVASDSLFNQIDEKRLSKE